jgi:acyl-coenzyme A thioesterase 13
MFYPTTIRDSLLPVYRPASPMATLASTMPPNDASILEHVEKFWQARLPHSPIYQFLLSDIKLTHASKGIVRARLLLSKNHINAHGGIHGSVSATLIDWVGGMAIAAWDNRTKTGVSTDIHISYQSSAKDGDWIEIEGNAGKVGGTLAFTTATIWKVVDDSPGPIVATGSHTKFVRV